MAKSVTQLLQDIRILGEEQYQLVEAVRALALKTIKPLSEEVKYGGILFSSGIPFSGVFAYKEHVSVEFSVGAKMADPDKVLEGGGKGRRHVKLRDIGELKRKNLAALLQRALSAARGDA